MCTEAVFFGRICPGFVLAKVAIQDNLVDSSSSSESSNEDAAERAFERDRLERERMSKVAKEKAGAPHTGKHAHVLGCKGGHI